MISDLRFNWQAGESNLKLFIPHEGENEFVFVSNRVGKLTLDFGVFGKNAGFHMDIVSLVLKNVI